MAVMPKQKPGKSEQSVETPNNFIEAVKARLGITDFTIDLAADATNTKAEKFFTEQDNSLVQEWPPIGWCWLNPPYGKIEPWVQKAHDSTWDGVKVAMLVPASVGSGWWFEYVSPKAYVTFLNPRLTFVGHKSPYPKDLALLLYTPFLEGGTCNWWWNQ